MMTAQPLAQQLSETVPAVADQPWSYRRRGHYYERVYRLVHLQAWREAVGWLRIELADYVQMGASTIARLEQGKSLASISTVIRLAEVFGIGSQVLIDKAPPEHLPRDHAYGNTYFIAESEGELCFKLPYLWYFLAYPTQPGLGSTEELAARTGLPALDLEAIRRCEKSAPYSWMQRIAAALGISLMELIYDRPNVWYVPHEARDPQQIEMTMQAERM